jgi:hypothetical protein
MANTAHKITINVYRKLENGNSELIFNIAGFEAPMGIFGIIDAITGWIDKELYERLALEPTDYVAWDYE